MRRWFAVVAARAAAAPLELVGRHRGDPNDWRGLPAAGSPLRQRILGDKGFYSKPGLWKDGCLGAPVVGAYNQIFLPEVAPNGSVATPRRAADVTCYVKTRLRQTRERPRSTRKGPGAGKRIAITVNGELQRMDPRTTIAERVVGPYAAKGFEVVVLLTLQGPRPAINRGDWHSARFAGLPERPPERKLCPPTHQH